FTDDPVRLGLTPAGLKVLSLPCKELVTDWADIGSGVRLSRSRNGMTNRERAANVLSRIADCSPQSRTCHKTDVAPSAKQAVILHASMRFRRAQRATRYGILAGRAAMGRLSSQLLRSSAKSLAD